MTISAVRVKESETAGIGGALISRMAEKHMLSGFPSAALPSQ